MRVRTKTRPIEEQAEMVFQAMLALGGEKVVFRAISERLGTDDLNLFRQGLKHLLDHQRIVQFGNKKGASYSINTEVPQKIIRDSSGDNTEETVNFVLPEIVRIEPTDYLKLLIDQATKSYTNTDLVNFLLAKYPDLPLTEYHLMIRTAVKQNKISYTMENRFYSEEPGNRAWFHPFAEEVAAG